MTAAVSWLAMLGAMTGEAVGGNYFWRPASPPRQFYGDSSEMQDHAVGGDDYRTVQGRFCPMFGVCRPSCTITRPAGPYRCQRLLVRHMLDGDAEIHGRMQAAAATMSCSGAKGHDVLDGYALAFTRNRSPGAEEVRVR